MGANEQIMLKRAVLANTRSHIRLITEGSFSLARAETRSYASDEGLTEIGYLICNNVLTFVGFIKSCCYLIRFSPTRMTPHSSDPSLGNYAPPFLVPHPAGEVITQVGSPEVTPSKKNQIGGSVAP